MNRREELPVHGQAGAWRISGSPRWWVTTTSDDGTPVEGYGASLEEAVGAAVLAAWRDGLVVTVGPANVEEDDAAT